jgi:deoxyribonuclease-4
MRLGAHVSISGGLHNAILNGDALGCECIQIFTKNQTRWFFRDRTEAEIQKYFDYKKKSDIILVISHAAYLINLASPKPEVYQKSLDAYLDEHNRCHEIEIPYLVIHPGAHLKKGEDYGIKKIAESINITHEKTSKYTVTTLLEITAGQGTSIGYRFQQIREIMDLVETKSRIDVCYDTCHAFVAGYDIRDAKSYEQTFQEFDDIIGLDHLKLFHLNDSKREFASKVDRHANIGEGDIGLEGFRNLLQDKRFDNIPGVLETPKGKDMTQDKKNLGILRRLRAR